MGQLAICLLGKQQEDMCSDPQHPCENGGWQSVSETFMLGYTEALRSLGLTDQLVLLIGKLRDSGEKKGGRLTICQLKLNP